MIVRLSLHSDSFVTVLSHVVGPVFVSSLAVHVTGLFWSLKVMEQDSQQVISEQLAVHATAKIRRHAHFAKTQRLAKDPVGALGRVGHVRYT